ncbi:MAG: hypothetical protein HY810_05590 [Candidatus Omnitrophica bacterium]|nr:hypothetical protein [Candidatus Omnitrophota bacterium]
MQAKFDNLPVITYYNAMTMQSLWVKWKIHALAAANFQIRLLLKVIYFIIILPYYLAFLTQKSRAKHLKDSLSSCWTSLPKETAQMEKLRRQF